MNPCESPFSLLLHHLYRRFHLSPPFCDAGAVDSRRILSDYAVREINLLLWFSLFGMTALLIIKLFKLFRLWFHGRLIPGPPCPSFYGHSVLFSPRDSSHDFSGFLVKSHKQFGSIVKLWLSPTQLLVSIKDPSLIHEMLSKAVDKLPFTDRVYRLAFGQSSFFVSSFEKVKKERELLILEMNRMLLEKASLTTDRVVEYVMERIDDIMDEGSLDCGTFSRHMAFSILGATLFGDAFFAWSKANVYEELLNRIAKDARVWASYSVPPFWKRGYWKYQNLCTRLKNLTQDIVQQCQLLCQPNGKSRNETDSDICVEDPSSQDSCECLSIQRESCGNVMGMMFHGCLTTSALVGNLLARLVMHPDIQEEIYAEVIRVQKQSDKLKKQDVSEMHLLLATVYESARLLPAGPLLQRCSLWQDLELKNGMRIPAGAMLVAPIQVVQTDELNWGCDAGQFNPYRFLTKTKNESHPGSHFNDAGAAVGVPSDLAEGSYVLNDPHKSKAFFPFGSGTRACVGQKFAVHGIASIFASLLKHYEIKKLHPESELNPKPLMVNCVLQLVPSPKIVFVPRHG